MKEIVYSSGEWITCVEQVKHWIEYGFHPLKSMRDLGQKLDWNEKMRVGGYFLGI